MFVPDKRSAFVTGIFRKYATGLQHFIMSKLGSVEDSEELVQEAFLKLYRSRQPETLQYPRAYLFSIAKNLIIDKLRRGDVAVSNASERLDEHDLIDPVLPIDQQVAQQQSLTDLSNIILRLPPKCRQVLILRIFHHQSYAQIATKMNISPRTVEKHLAKGLLRCRNAMQAKSKKSIKILSTTTHQSIKKCSLQMME
jgi:RNA polymerase sigma factor (sigma-70 family)